MQVCGCNLPNYYNEPFTLPNGSHGCNGSAIVLFMTILETLLQNSCKINNPCGRVVPRTAPDDEYDFIVVGGGSSGSVVAGRLAEVAQENCWKILLLEVGRDEPAYSQVPYLQRYAAGTDIDWKFTTEEPVACLLTGGECSWPRGKVLGGSGAINSMVYLRATRKDAERWIAAGNTDWTYEELLRLYKKSEDNLEFLDAEYHSKGGPWTIQRFNNFIHPATFEILESVKQAGFKVVDDLNGEVNHGFARLQCNQRNSQRLSTSKAFLWPQKDNRNLHIMINSTATKILIGNANGTKRATGVELIYNNKTYHVRARKEVILAAGAVQTPQVLLVSGIGDKNELDKVGIKQVHNLPSVGQGLQDHVNFYLEYSTNLNASRYAWFTVTDYLTDERGPLSSFWINPLAGRINTSYSTQDDPDGQILFASLSETGDFCDKPGNYIFSIRPVVIQPRSRGKISLRSSNITEPPKIVANYYTNKTDLQIMLELVRLSQRIASAPILEEKFGKLQFINRSFHDICSESYTYDSDSWWICAMKYGSTTLFHPSSSCRMGPSSDPDACVNQKLQLHGIENIRVADASVFPTIVSANLQATVVAVAEKAAEMIISQYTRKL